MQLGEQKEALGLIKGTWLVSHILSKVIKLKYLSGSSDGDMRLLQVPRMVQGEAGNTCEGRHGGCMGLHGANTWGLMH